MKKIFLFFIFAFATTIPMEKNRVIQIEPIFAQLPPEIGAQVMDFLPTFGREWHELSRIYGAANKDLQKAANILEKKLTIESIDLETLQKKICELKTFCTESDFQKIDGHLVPKEDKDINCLNKKIKNLITASIMSKMGAYQDAINRANYKKVDEFIDDHMENIEQLMVIPDGMASLLVNQKSFYRFNFYAELTTYSLTPEFMHHIKSRLRDSEIRDLIRLQNECKCLAFYTNHFIKIIGPKFTQQEFNKTKNTHWPILLTLSNFILHKICATSPIPEALKIPVTILFSFLPFYMINKILKYNNTQLKNLAQMKQFLDDDHNRLLQIDSLIQKALDEKKR